MTVLFEKEMENLKKLILTEGSLVEEAIARAIQAFLNRDVEQAQAVIRDDNKLDRMEIDVEEECLKILALHHPVANDLRFVVAVLKINNDLERMGDLAANIAKRADSIARNEPIRLEFDFPGMAVKAQSMVRRSIDALVARDAALARQVCIDDDELDVMRRSLHRIVPARVEQKPEAADLLIEYLAIARHLERLGDMATNVAEDVIYMAEGEIIRHRLHESAPPPR